MQEWENEEYTVLGGAQEADEGSLGRSLEKLQDYRYFSGKKIRESVRIKPQAAEAGRRLAASGKLKIKKVFCGYDKQSHELHGQIEAVRRETQKEFPVQIVFSRDKVVWTDCLCKACIREYARYTGGSSCENVAGLLELLEQYLKNVNIGDATDPHAQSMFSAFREKRSHILEAVEAREESLSLAPRVIKKEGKLTVSFKVGYGKLFVVKDLEEFCENVKHSTTAVYGSNTQINHSLHYFKPQGRRWIRYISRIVREETQFAQRLEDSRYYSRNKVPTVSSLELFGWRLDQFYEELGDMPVDFEDKDTGERQKGSLYAGKGNPKVTLQIDEYKIRGDKEFHGIEVAGTLPELFFGMDTAYYIRESTLYRLDQEFFERIEVLEPMTRGGHFSFCVGRNLLAEFYYRVLPQFEGVMDIIETNPEKFRSYLIPEAKFVFYLDADDETFICLPKVHYGNKEFSVLDSKEADRSGITIAEVFRDVQKEREVLEAVERWFPCRSFEKEKLLCKEDEESLYRVVESGVHSLMELGEVRCTNRFCRRNVIRRIKTSIGVSVSGSLLNLDISTEEISREELLEVLKGYRMRKRYYRLKDGAFIDMKDPSLEMLAELDAVMHFSPKEFSKGKLQLPAYRGLYLDRLMEEKKTAYGSRDSHFREMVKGFKTIKEAEFEEPESLSGIMRMYQKNGYKWLRTLEQWRFGGILADDMGLGKTLQMIAVLLAAKQEGKRGCSLVITPASLVFNWREEFKRFAPEISVRLIVGTQEERRARLDAQQEADVFVTSYDLLKRDIAFYEGKTFLYQVVDEAQYIKNHTTAAAKAVKAVKSEFRFALTGTPIENRLSELWSIFDFLMPGFLYGYDVFRREFEIPIIKNKEEGAMKRLQKMAGPFILRRMKEAVLNDLPEKLEEIRYVWLEGEQKRLYDAQAVRMKELLSRQSEEDLNRNRLQILAEMMKLRQICCDPALCFENYQGMSAKAEACLELIQSAMDGGYRLLLFSQFTSMLEIFQRRLEKAGISYYVITGATPKEKRLQMVRQYNEGAVPVFLISLKAGGVGLNLTGADMVVHVDPWWNLAAQNQATDRAHRIGQTKKVMVYKMIVKNSIEEKIRDLQERKRELAEQVIGGEARQLGSMTKEEILALLESIP